MTKDKAADMPEVIWISFATASDVIGRFLRKWDTSPFESGQKYIRADRTPDISQEEALEAQEAIKAARTEIEITQITRNNTGLQIPKISLRQETIEILIKFAALQAFAGEGE